MTPPLCEWAKLYHFQTPLIFTDFKEEFFADQTVCPDNGIVDWSNGKITCSIHIEDTSSGG